MKALRTVTTLSIFLRASLAFCGVIGSYSVGGLLTQADQVVVATVRNSSSAGLKGSAIVGPSITATLSHPNVKASTPEVVQTVQTSSSVSANLLVGRTGLWFLQQSGTGWIVLPLMSGDISEEDLYLPVHSGTLPSAFAYDTSAAPKTKLIQEIGAAAQDPTTAAVMSRLEAMRVFSDLGADVLPMFAHLTVSPEMGTMAMGLAGQIRLGTPSALQAMVSSNMGMFPQNAQNQLANSVCEYRNTDAGGIGALSVLLGPQYSDSVRACATHALREIHSPQTMPLLEKLLNDSSAQLRYDAVIGIAQFAMSFPMVGMVEKPAAMATFTPPPSVTNEMRQHYPGQGLFLKNEQEYISYWKTWLAAHPAQ